MARPLRIEYPGAFYDVTSRGNERKAIYGNRADRERFLSYLESAHDRYRAAIHAFCLMENHYHLLVETPQGNLSEILHHINGAYTNYYNTKRQRSGHLFQGRYKAVLVEKDAYLQVLSRYIHLNPVRAGLVEHPSAYPWSSYPYYVGMKKRPEWLVTGNLLGFFGEEDAVAGARYRGFVEDGIGNETERPLKDVFAGTFLGSKEFIERVKAGFPGMKELDPRDVPAVKRMRSKPSLDEIIQAVKWVVGEQSADFRKWCLLACQDFGGYALNGMVITMGWPVRR